jgi:hypothetical protein
MRDGVPLNGVTLNDDPEFVLERRIANATFDSAGASMM